MAVTVRQKSEIVGTGTSPTLAEPAGAKDGDVLLAISTSAVAGAVTRPAGWTQLYTGIQGSIVWDVSWIRRGQSAPSLTWAVTGSVYREVFIVCLQSTGGLITLNSQASAGAAANASGYNPNPPPTTPTAPSSLAVSGAVTSVGSAPGGWTTPAGYTIQTANAAGDDCWLGTKSLSAPGIEDPAALANDNLAATDYWDGFTVTFTDVPVLTAGYGSSPPVIKRRVPPQQLLGD